MPAAPDFRAPLFPAPHAIFAFSGNALHVFIARYFINTLRGALPLGAAFYFFINRTVFKAASCIRFPARTHSAACAFFVKRNAAFSVYRICRKSDRGVLPACRKRQIKKNTAGAKAILQQFKVFRGTYGLSSTRQKLPQKFDKILFICKNKQVFAAHMFFPARSRPALIAAQAETVPTQKQIKSIFPQKNPARI